MNENLGRRIWSLLTKKLQVSAITIKTIPGSVDVQFDELSMPDNQETTIVATPVIIVGFLSGIAAILVLADFVFLLLRVAGGYPHVFGLARTFDLNEEGNVPAFFSAVLLFFCFCLFAIIWLFKKRQNDSFTMHWGILIFALLDYMRSNGYELLLKFDGVANE